VGAGTAITSVAWVLARALALATLVLLIQALPADDLGALLAAIAAGLLAAALATGGLPDSAARSAAWGLPSGEAGFARGDLRSALVRFGLTLPFVFVLLALLSDTDEGLDWRLLIAGVLLAATQGGTSILAAVFRARGQAARFALATGLGVAVGRTIVAALALLLDAGLGFVLWSFVALNGAVIAVTARAATRDLPPGRSEGQGAGALQLGGAAWALLAHLDIVVVGVVLGADAAGVYGATLRLADFSYQFVVAVSVLYLPEAVKLFAADRRQALVALYRTSSRWSALVSLLLAGVGFVIAPELAALLLAEDAAKSTTVMRILFVGYAVFGAFGLGYLTCVAAGTFREIQRAALLAIPAIVAGTVAGAELWGLTGAACATTAGYIVFNLWWLWVAKRTVRATPFDGPYLRSLLACALSVAGSALVALLLEDAPPAVGLTVAAVAGLLLWLGAAALTAAVTPGEFRALRRLAARPRGRTAARHAMRG
jgi:O-antigen/teichoic acid export membrane protein